MVKNFAAVSGHHLTIIFARSLASDDREIHVAVQDMKSVNGTLVGGVKLPKGGLVNLELNVPVTLAPKRGTPSPTVTVSCNYE